MRGPRKAFVLGALLSLGTAAVGQAATELPSLAEARAVNDQTVGIVFHYEDIYRQYVNDISGAFANQSEGPATELRMVPMLGVNHVQTMLDILYMRGVDLGIVHADVFEYMARVRGYEQVYQRINSVVELFDEKVAIIAGEQYASLDELAGEKVNFRAPGKGSDVTGTILFDTLGIEVEKTRFDKLEALEKVKSGEIAAMIYLIEEPVAEFQALAPADKVHLIELPQNEVLLEHYYAAELTEEEFPELASKDEPVTTLSVPVIIAAYNWPAREQERYARSERFVTALVDSLDELKASADTERWKDVELGTDIPGPTRLALVDSVVERQAAEQQRLAAAETARKTAELKEKQTALTRQLEARLDQQIADTSEPAELDRLLEQLETLLDRIE